MSPRILWTVALTGRCHNAYLKVKKITLKRPLCMRRKVLTVFARKMATVVSEGMAEKGEANEDTND